MRLTIFCLCFNLLIIVDGYEFLAFVPLSMKSHHRVYRPIFRRLAESGHHVTVVTSFPIDAPPVNYSQIIVEDFSSIQEHFGKKGDETSKHLHTWGIWDQIKFVFMKFVGVELTNRTLNDPAVVDLIRSDRKFDGIFISSSFYQEAFVVFGHKFNAPIIEILPAGNLHWTYWLHGNPYDASYIVDMMLPYTDEMTFLERLHNTAHSYFYTSVWLNYYLPQYQSLVDTHMRYPGWESRPPLIDMLRNSSLVLLNTDIALNYPYPMSPHFKEIGGVNLVQSEPLPKDIQSFMDSATHGVIYFSMGSIIEGSSTLGQLKNDFIKAFSKLKQKILWKWETELSDAPDNVMIRKWFPQQDILAHKNTVIFISHGGFLSLTEAVYNGVPMIGIPIQADQNRNIVHMRSNGYGIHMAYSNISEQSISWAINEILSNPMYKKNSEERSKMLKDRPFSPLDTAQYWIEYIVRHNGADHLKPSVLKLKWYQESLIDVYLVILILVFLPLYFIYKCGRYLFKKVCKSKSKPQIIKSKKNK